MPRLAPAQVLLEANAKEICSLIHASILKIGRSYVSSTEEADFMARARQFAARWVGGRAVVAGGRLWWVAGLIGERGGAACLVSASPYRPAPALVVSLPAIAAIAWGTAPRRPAATSRPTGSTLARASGGWPSSCSPAGCQSSSATWRWPPGSRCQRLLPQLSRHAGMQATAWQSTLVSVPARASARPAWGGNSLCPPPPAHLPPWRPCLPCAV